MTILPTLPNIPPYLLTRIGASAMDALERYGWLEQRAPTHTRTLPSPGPLPEAARPPKRSHNKPKDAPPRVYASQYKGVTSRKGGWTSNWCDGKWKIGRLRPHGEQGERWAAQDRARALGVEYLELRSGERVPYLWKATEEMEG